MGDSRGGVTRIFTLGTRAQQSRLSLRESTPVRGANGDYVPKLFFLRSLVYDRVGYDCALDYEEPSESTREEWLAQILRHLNGAPSHSAERAIQGGHEEQIHEGSVTDDPARVVKERC